MMRKLIFQSDEFKTAEKAKYSYIDYFPFKIAVDSVLSFFTYLLLLNTMIPISHQV